MPVGTTGTPIRRGETIGLGILLAASFAAAFVPSGLNGAIELLVGWIPVAFAFWHFARWAGAGTAVLSFVVISVVSFTAEAVGVATGLVFGPYSYADGPLGPLVLGVPPLILLEYFVMGYSSYFLARIIAGDRHRRLTVPCTVGVAALAAFLITLLDLASDPWKSTELGLWVWRDAGAYFGVPVHNFVGWWTEAFLFFIVVGLLLRRGQPAERILVDRGRTFDLYGVLLYGTFPFGVVMTPLLHGSSEIADAMACVAVFAVVPMVVIGLLAVTRGRADATETRPPVRGS